MRFAPKINGFLFCSTIFSSSWQGSLGDGNGSGHASLDANKNLRTKLAPLIVSNYVLAGFDVKMEAILKSGKTASEQQNEIESLYHEMLILPTQLVDEKRCADALHATKFYLGAENAEKPSGDCQAQLMKIVQSAKVVGFRQVDCNEWEKKKREKDTLVGIEIKTMNSCRPTRKLSRGNLRYLRIL